jgi:2-keto-4-pentenoate hydratase/2-oxohepta-3-ene-1,7-dioic acid hydratase in catechol pathway
MKIICIGRNYAEHTKELNNAIPDNPVVFIKPSTALLKCNADFYYPLFTQDLHYECEVVLRVCKNGKFIQENFASTYFDAFTLGIDFTARDLQELQKKKGLPWEIAKAFDNSAVIGDMIPFTTEMKTKSIQFQLQKNGIEVQNGNTADMLFSFEKIIAYTSQFFSLQQGDLIFTGTPSGVGPVAIGDNLVGLYDGEEVFSCAIK